MTSIPFFQIDAFAARPLTGNQAAVMPLERWLDDRVMQAIAAENNLAETAFTIPSASNEADFDLRWFTPEVEVELCGHATLAAGHAMMTGDSIRFSTRSGILTVTRHDDSLELDLPAAELHETEHPDLCAALGVEPRPLWAAEGCNDAVVVPLADEAEVRSVSPDFAALKAIPKMAIVTAPGEDQDIASRVFVSYVGIDEDAATGSAHSALAPYWARRLGRDEFTALQASRRGGFFHCRLKGDRVTLGGQCYTVIAGTFQL